MKLALLVIDVQKEFLPMMSEGDRTLAPIMIKGANWLFHRHGFPVIRVYHTDPPSDPSIDPDGFQFDSSIRVRDEDPRVIKNYRSSLKKTDLAKLLEEQGCNTGRA